MTAANEISSAPLAQVRDQATNVCINILYSYRKFCATVSSSGQLILPEALKLLPLYTLGMTHVIWNYNELIFALIFRMQTQIVSITVVVCSPLYLTTKRYKREEILLVENRVYKL